MPFLTKRNLLLLMYIILIIFVAIRGSIYKTYEHFINGIFVADARDAVKLFETSKGNQETLIPSNQGTLSDEELRRLSIKNKWNDCNIFTCKNKSSLFDYELWLQLQKEKEETRKHNEMLLRNKNNGGTSDDKRSKQCPPRISFDDWNDDILNGDELEQLNRVDDLEAQEMELNDRLKELEAQYNESKAQFESDINSMQQMQNDMERSNANQKDQKVYENAVDTYVKPWQKLIENLGKDVEKLQTKVNSYDPSIKSITTIPKQLDELKKKLDSLGAPAPAPAPAKKKKKKSVLKKIFKK
jgi:hypothetical protein